MERGNQGLIGKADLGAGIFHRQGSRPSIPLSLAPFFPEYDLASLDLERSASTIIGRILQFGDREEIHWLFSVYSLQAITSWVHQWGGIALPEPHRTFWSLVLGSDGGNR